VHGFSRLQLEAELRAVLNLLSMRKQPLRISTIPTLHNDEGLRIKKMAAEAHYSTE
jgi:hypothetical protein